MPIVYWGNSSVTLKKPLCLIVKGQSSCSWWRSLCMQVRNFSAAITLFLQLLIWPLKQTMLCRNWYVENNWAPWSSTTALVILLQHFRMVFMFSFHLFTLGTKGIKLVSLFQVKKSLSACSICSYGLVVVFVAWRVLFFFFFPPFNFTYYYSGCVIFVSSKMKFR